MEWKIPVAIALVFFGCCSNVVFLELIIKFDTGAGNIITFFQFLVIAVEGLIFESRFFTKKPVIPVKNYLYMVCFFFTVSVVNNYALHFKIPLPLHMIFRSGSLIANLVLGILYLNKKYTASKYIGVFMVTIGITMATMASAGELNKEVIQPYDEEDDLTVEIEDDSEWVEESSLTDFMYLCIGILMLLFALFVSAAMGIYQEMLYSEHGKHPKEAMFYSHALPLPWFLALAPDLLKRVSMFNSSEPFIFGIISIPSMWMYLLMNGITQYICITGVFTLTTECPSLVVTLIITLRKFFSLIFSIIYFRNSFTLTHWCGTILVFSGTLFFTGVLNTIAERVGIIKPVKQVKQD